MMAKMFYTLEETKSALGKSEEEVKQFAREGRLREFRDGPRLVKWADFADFPDSRRFSADNRRRGELRRETLFPLFCPRDR